MIRRRDLKNELGVTEIGSMLICLVFTGGASHVTLHPEAEIISTQSDWSFSSISLNNYAQVCKSNQYLKDTTSRSLQKYPFFLGYYCSSLKDISLLQYVLRGLS